MKDKYIFKGYATDAYDNPLGYYELATYADSRKKAINNFKFQIKKLLGLNSGYGVYISESNVRGVLEGHQDYTQVHEVKEPMSINYTSDISKCEICGTPLTDSGSCPRCDDGEEDY